MNSPHLQFPNTGIYITQLTQEQLKPIHDEINSIMNDWNRNEKHNQWLAGQIEKEYALTDCYEHLESLLIPIVKEYDLENDFVDQLQVLSRPAPLYLTRSWVNFQKKGEWNPPHGHHGILSFVIWIKIPYLFKDEEQAGPGKDSANSLAGKFSMQYTDILGQIRYWHINADKTHEGTIILFPSKLQHMVHPFFTSDEYRISVSGNIKFGI